MTKFELNKKFKKIEKLVHSLPKTEFLVYLLIVEFTFLWFSVEKILIDKKFKGNIYSKPSKLLENLILKLTEMKKMSDYTSGKKVSPKLPGIDKMHKKLFQDLWQHYNKNEFINDRLKPYIKRVRLNKLVPLIKGKKCIDFACGHGQFLMALKKLGAKYCLGLDFGIQSINYANKMARSLKFNKKNLKYIVSKVQKTPIKSNSFDFAIQNGSFHHIEEYKNEIKAYKEVHRVLKKNGYFFVFTAGEAGLKRLIMQENSTKILSSFDPAFIVKVIRSLPISNNKKYMLSDALIAKYRYTNWKKHIIFLKRVGFKFVRPLRGHALTDFDKYFSKDKLFKSKFGDGHIRLLCRKI